MGRELAHPSSPPTTLVILSLYYLGFACSGSHTSRSVPLIWGEGDEQLNMYLKDLREGNWTRPPFPATNRSCDTVPLHQELHVQEVPYAGPDRWCGERELKS